MEWEIFSWMCEDVHEWDWNVVLRLFIVEKVASRIWADPNMIRISRATFFTCDKAVSGTIWRLEPESSRVSPDRVIFHDQIYLEVNLLHLNNSAWLPLRSMHSLTTCLSVDGFMCLPKIQTAQRELSWSHHLTVSVSSIYWWTGHIGLFSDCTSHLSGYVCSKLIAYRPEVLFGLLYNLV